MKNKFKDMLGSSFFIIIILLAISLITLTPILNMLFLGLVISYGISPIANKIQSKIKFSSISIILSIILVVIPLILVFIYTIFVVFDFSYSFLSTNNSLTSFNIDKILEVINSYLLTEMHYSSSAITTSITQMLSDGVKLLLSYFVDFIKSLPMIMLQIFVLIFSIYYFTKDGYKLNEYVFSFIPEEKQSYFNRMILEIKLVLKSIFYGHFLTGVIIGIMGAIGFYILGYDYALFLGILTGICQLIPVIGPWPIYTILFISDILSGNYIRAIIVLLFGFGLSLSDMYIKPALSSKYIDIHPLILLLGFLSGPIVFGLIGFIVGPLILGITYAVIKAYKEEKEKINMDT